MGGDLAKQFAKAVTLEFKGDKTFSMNMVFPVEGTYELNGNTATMKLTKMNGMETTKMNTGDANQGPGNAAILATLSDDGKSLTLTPPAGATGGTNQPFKFVRAPS